MGGAYSTNVNVSLDTVKNNLFSYVVYTYAKLNDENVVFKQLTENDEPAVHVLPEFYNSSSYYEKYSEHIDNYFNTFILGSQEEYNKFMEFYTTTLNKPVSYLPKAKKYSKKLPQQSPQQSFQNSEDVPCPQRQKQESFYQDMGVALNKEAQQVRAPEAPETSETSEAQPKKKSSGNRISKKIHELESNIMVAKHNKRNFDTESVKTAEGLYEQDSV
jgi:hypothetical protein